MGHEESVARKLLDGSYDDGDKIPDETPQDGPYKGH